jgi:hypothetical protein
MKLYIYSVDNLTEARFACASNANYLGFCLTPGQRNYIDPVKLSAILPWLSGPQFVGQFLYEPSNTILTQVEILGLQVIEIPASHPDREVLRKRIPLIVRFENEEEPFQVFENETGMLYPAFHPDSIHQAIIDPKEDINKILQQITDLKPLGIAFSGESEQEPGMAELSHWSEWLDEIGWEGLG